MLLRKYVQIIVLTVHYLKFGRPFAIFLKDVTKKNFSNVNFKSRCCEIYFADHRILTVQQCCRFQVYFVYLQNLVLLCFYIICSHFSSQTFKLCLHYILLGLAALSDHLLYIILNLAALLPVFLIDIENMNLVSSNF